MKRSIIITLCVLGLYGCGQKRPAVIERPVFELSNTRMIEIDKIEMSDTATIIYFDAYGSPGNWILATGTDYIRESGSDEKLMFTGVEGINRGERYIIPESGTVSFKQFYPPLRPEVTKIDYLEDCTTGCWKIWGIHLLPNAKIKMEPVPKNLFSEPLPVPEFSMQPARVSGRMLGYVEGMTPSEITIYANNIITGEQVETKIPVAEDGSFSGEITPGISSICSSTIGPLFLIPGKEITIVTDLKKRSRYQSRYRTDKMPDDSIFTYISGSCFTSAELESIQQARYNLFDFQKLMQETVSMKPDEFKQHLLGIMNVKLDELKQKTYSANMQMMIENVIKFETYSMLMQYEVFINTAYLRVNNIKREDWDKVTFKAEKPDEDYYSILKGQITDNMSFLPIFRSLTSSLPILYSLPDGKDKPVEECFAYFKERFASVLGTDQGILFDVIHAQFYARQLSDMKFFTDVEKHGLHDIFKDKPAFAEALIAENDKVVALISANKDNKECVAHETPNVPQEKVFDAILAKYRGKVVVVDFWATWCGPCMQAMKSIKPMKDEMKGKDIVWLYLTGETSPLNTWMITYSTISGEHYRVSEAQWNFWYKIYGIEGIPTYMVYDRNGKQISRHLGFPGVGTMKKDIEKGEILPIFRTPN